MLKNRITELKGKMPDTTWDYWLMLPACLCSTLIMAEFLTWKNSGIFFPVLVLLSFWLFQARLISQVADFRQKQPELLSDSGWQNIGLFLWHFRYPLLLLAFTQIGVAVHWREYNFVYDRGIRYFEETFVTFVPRAFYPHWLQAFFSYSLIFIMQCVASSISIVLALRFSKFAALGIRVGGLVLIILGWVIFATTVLADYRYYVSYCFMSGCPNYKVEQNILRSMESSVLIASSMVDGGALISQEFIHPYLLDYSYSFPCTEEPCRPVTYTLGFGLYDAAWRYLIAWACSIVSMLGLTRFILKYRSGEKRKNGISQ
jgi:hypothetical protein